MQNLAGTRSRTGVRNVRLHHSGSYQVEVTARGVVHYGGAFQSLEDAEAAATALRAKLHDPIPELAVVGSAL